MSYRSRVKYSDFHSDTTSFFKGKKVCVAGGSGFIGSHVVDQLLELGAQPVVPSRKQAPRFLKHVTSHIELRQLDLSGFDHAKKAVEGCDIVLNMAAEVAGIEYNKNHPASIFQNNLEVFFNLIKASQQQEQVERFLVTSSACVYPRFCTIPTPEEEGVKDEPEPTNSGYGWAKRMEEYLGQKYSEEYGLSVAIGRPYNGYGPRDNFNPASSHVIPALIRKVMDAEDGVFQVWGDGTHSRSFLYVDDFARGLLEVAARYTKADPVNIGADEEVTIKDTALMITKIISEIKGTEIKPVFNPQGTTGQPRRRCDTTKIEAELGYKARVNLEDGLKQTIDWYVKQ